MNQPARWVDSNECEPSAVQPSRRLSFLKFMLRYPIFFLAFGPPIFRAHSAQVGVDTSQAHFDFWAALKVAWLFVIVLRAILRLTSARSILIPSQIRSILRLLFFLGLLYLLSVAYSPGRIVSAEFSILYFLTMICVAEFIVDVYRYPPDWVQCLFHLRFIAFLALAVILLALAYNPALVFTVIPGAGIRLLGGEVGNTALLAAVIALISAYSFLHSLESKGRSTIFFLIGLAGTIVTQARGWEIALIFSLAILGFQWAKTSRYAAHIFISGLMAFILLAGAAAGVIGSERIWRTFNRGQDIAGIETASGRTEIWKFVFSYCMTHPQGMGYQAGFRYYYERSHTLDAGLIVTHLGNSHNSFVQVLADAGWLALALYLLLNARIVALGLRFAKKHGAVTLASEDGTRHAIRCSLLLLIYCFMAGMDGADFDVPLVQTFYFQYIIVAILLGASARMLLASRSRQPALTE